MVDVYCCGGIVGFEIVLDCWVVLFGFWCLLDFYVLWVIWVWCVVNLVFMVLLDLFFLLWIEVWVVLILCCRKVLWFCWCWMNFCISLCIICDVGWWFVFVVVMNLVCRLGFSFIVKMVVFDMVFLIIRYWYCIY